LAAPQMAPRPDFGPPYRVPPAEVRAEEDLLRVLRATNPIAPHQHGLFEPDAKHNRPSRGLHLAGNAELLQRRKVAIVGAREATSAGLTRARRLARELVAEGITIVSGLARGIDTAALEAALEAGGSVIAVIGTPLDTAYPAENRRLQERIYTEQLLISPFADGTQTYKSSFPQRNRVMAALADATVIMEASDTSGTLHQAAECGRLGRWLFIAKSVTEDPKLKWPARFLGQPLVAVLSTTADILEKIKREGE